MGIINLDDSARGKWLHNFTKMLEKHTKTLQELSPDSDGRLHSITYDLEKAVGVLTLARSPSNAQTCRTARSKNMVRVAYV